MTGVLKWLEGKKTYLVAVGIGAVAVLRALGVEIPPVVWPILAALGLGAIRAGVKKSES